MNNIKKVIKGLEGIYSCVSPVSHTCGNCPYQDNHVECKRRVVSDALELLKAQPEIIHCKDCVHHHYESSGTPYCDNIDYGYGWRDDDFCSRAERKMNQG